MKSIGRRHPPDAETSRPWVVPLGAIGALLVVGEALRLSAVSGRVGVLLSLLLVQLAVAALSIGWSGWRPSFSELGAKNVLPAIVPLIVVTAVGYTGVWWLAESVGIEPTEPGPTTLGPPVILAILTSAALAEEMVFRGAILFGRLNVWGPKVAVSASTIGFAVVHTGAGPMAVVTALFTGLLWGVVALRKRSFALAVATHLVWNLLVFAGWMLT